MNSGGWEMRMEPWTYCARILSRLPQLLLVKGSATLLPASCAWALPNLSKPVQREASGK